MISDSNWTEWSTNQGVIAREMSISDEREARGRFAIQANFGIDRFHCHAVKK